MRSVKKVIALGSALALQAMTQAMINPPLVFAAGEDGSMSEVWDGEASQGQPAKKTASAGSFTLRTPSTQAPLCTLSSFKESDFVQSASWPGVGPFKESADNPNVFEDPGDNRVKLTVENDKITACELELAKDSKQSKNILSTQMAADFLLEALGAKPGKIAAFNAQLDKSKVDWVSKKLNRITVETAAPYVIFLNRPEENAVTVTVSASDNPAVAEAPAPKKSQAGANKAVEANAPTPPSKATTPLVSTTTTNSTKPPEEEWGWDSNSTQGQATKAQAVASSQTTAPKPPAAAKQPARPRALTNTMPAAEATHESTSTDSIKTDLEDAIRHWQSIKKVALKQVQATDLPTVLAGKALATQMTSIKWLTDHKSFYEFDPKPAVVDKYTELVKGQKYVAVTQIKEHSKYINGATGAVMKETDDGYTVNYTLEKINGNWMITDSAVQTSTTAQAKGKTGKPNTGKSNH